MQNHEDNCLRCDENAVAAMAFLSSIGDRDSQQDCFGYSLKNNEGIVVICDGMGGHEGGAIASSIAVANFLEDYEKHYPCANPAELLRETARKTDNQISTLKSADGKLMKAGSTCVAVIIKDRKLFWCSVGDSRVYLLREGEFFQLTQDQNYRTVLIEKLKAGLISATDVAEEAERGDALISYLGIGGCSLNDYSVAPIELRGGDRILLMSDGLYKVVSDEEIKRITENFKNIAEALRALDAKSARLAKNLKESRDNTTIALIAVKE